MYESMNNVLLVLLLVVLSQACIPGQNWSHTDTAMEVAFAGELAADAVTTPAVLARCAEANPVIGECGDRMPLVFYMPASMALHFAVAWMLPPRARLYWQAITLGAEGHVAVMNYLDNEWYAAGNAPRAPR